MKPFPLNPPRSICIALLAAVSVPLLLGPTRSERVRAEYVGVGVCQKCHGLESIGNQYRIWAASTHASAYVVLKGGKGREVAQRVGVENPPADRKCLKCHTTGGGKSDTTKTEGVGCEACHGPGSEYFEFSNHASFLDRQNAYRKAITLGMYPVLGVEGIKAREKLCKNCHREERPCAPTDIEEKKRRRLSLSLIADLPSKLKHPLRR
ncbi:MAG TPA: cytochrome c family protein [Spirochaetota bacterium]|nr:cytochrome c family protein [Spirochaetota bacterium]